MSIERRFALIGHLHTGTYLPLSAGATYPLTNDLYIESIAPSIWLTETDAATDELVWRFVASGGTLYLQARKTDGSSSNNPFLITRTGHVIDQIQINTTLASISGACTIGGSAASSSVNAGSYLSVNTATNTGAARIEVYTADGTNNQRMWMFSDDNTNYVGIDYTYSSGLNGFELRRAGTAWLSLNSTGSVATITPQVLTPNLFSNEIGYKGVPQVSIAANYTLVLTDAGKSIYKASGAAVTVTIPANSSVAFPIGTTIDVINVDTEALSIAITTDTMWLSPGGTTGTRTLAQWGHAKLTKVNSTSWGITGSGLT